MTKATVRLEFTHDPTQEWNLQCVVHVFAEDGTPADPEKIDQFALDIEESFPSVGFALQAAGLL